MRNIIQIIAYWLMMQSVLAQQNDFFREAKTKYDVKELEISSEYHRVYPLLTGEQKNQLNKEYDAVMLKLDSVRNEGYLEALIKTKVALDLGFPTNEEERIFPEKSSNYNSEAEYLTGEDGLRKELVENFYTKNLIGEGVLSANLRFLVEKDGRINSVEVVNGKNREFNKQAEITLYLMSFYFTPAYRSGRPTRSFYSIPIKINLD